MAAVLSPIQYAKCKPGVTLHVQVTANLPKQKLFQKKISDNNKSHESTYNGPFHFLSAPPLPTIEGQGNLRERGVA